MNGFFMRKETAAMIKNVVLDIGNVMVTYYPDIYIANFVDRKGGGRFLPAHLLREHRVEGGGSGGR